jgi:hypothetical protein
MNMRAKFRVTEVKTPYEGQEELHWVPVTESPFNEHGISEDNTYSKWTPSGELRMVITNPALLGKYEVGDKYYLDFIKAEQ